MTEPIRKVAMHWGTNTLWGHSAWDEDAENYKHVGLPLARALFKGPATAAAWLNGSGEDAGQPTTVRMIKIFGRLNNPVAGRGLLVAILDGRFVDGFGDRQGQPCFRAGGPSDPREVLAQLVRATKAHKSQVPVDVFMLTAIRPNFINLYAQKLPKGSIITAIKTPNKTNDYWFSHLDANLALPDGTKSGRKRWAYTPGAPDILVDYIMSGAPMVGAPYVAVSGHRALPLHDAWQEIAKRPRFEDWKARQTDTQLLVAPWRELQAAFFAQEEPATIARLEWLAQQRGYNHDKMNYIRDWRSVRPQAFLTQAIYAYAALELSARVFGPQHSWALLDEARAGVRRASPFAPAPLPVLVDLELPLSVQSNDTTEQKAKPVPTAPKLQANKPTRLTPAQLASLPPKLRKAADAAPRLVKRLLRS